MRKKSTIVSDLGSESLSKLEDNVHTALRDWHKLSANVSPLEDLYLFQQVQREARHTHEATNKVILTALQALETDHSHYARLLRLRFLDQMKAHTIAGQLSIAEGTVYRQQREAIHHLTVLLHTLESQARIGRQTILERHLNLPSQVKLIGVQHDLNVLLDLLTLAGPPWIVSIEGIGGIGKTTLANGLVHEIILTDQFKDIAWVSAKQQDFRPATGIQPTNQPALDIDTLTTSLLYQLNPETSLPASPQAKIAKLTKLLKEFPYLIVIDNLETVIDYQSLLPPLQKLANPSRFLLTSRYSLQAYSDVYCLSMKELDSTNTLAFLRHEAQARGIPTLAQASQVELENIYKVVGGNPLALKLIVGQIRFLSLSHVLENLKQARGKKVDQLYTYIYWQAWQALDKVSQKVLLAMPLAQDGNFAQLASISKLKEDELNDALDYLVTLCLVEVHGNLAECRYRIHRLTETFLLTEVTKWQSIT